MTIQEAYLQLQAASGIKVGDKVKFISWPTTQEAQAMGWQNSMVHQATDHNRAIGCIGTVTLVGNNGIKVRTKELDTNYWYPFFMLEKQERKDAVVILNGLLTAVVARESKRVAIGCQVFSFDNVKQVHEGIAKAKAALGDQYMPVPTLQESMYPTDWTPLQRAYKLMQDASGIKPGDTVKVVRAAKESLSPDQNELGWGASYPVSYPASSAPVRWSADKNEFVGKTFKVKKPYNEYQTYILIDATSAGFPDGRGVPFFCLEVVEKSKVNTEVELSAGGLPLYVNLATGAIALHGYRKDPQYIITIDTFNKLYEEVLEAEKD